MVVHVRYPVLEDPPMYTSSLTATKVQNAKATNKPYKLTDGQGLFLQVTSSGSKLWRFKYFIGGKEKLISFGSYPEISLADARERRDAARKQVANGIDPGEVRKAQKAAKEAATENEFEVIASEWH